ncbi:helix-turn-helix domain-containing protein [Nocardiopsis sediminis]|uniref:Helix-turn-helix domain-containing protein n=1 Tax=Nocardiopsis sediminis TaxID=1778267 RepID=A0ABV8FPE7_9ACTN
MPTETRFSTDDLPVHDRFDAWREVISRTHAPLEMTSEHAGDFYGSQRILELDGVLVWPTLFRSLTFHRTPKLIRCFDPEAIHISFVLRGSHCHGSGAHEHVYGPAGIHPIDTSTPFTLATVAAGPLVSGIGLEIPKALIPLPQRSVARAVGRTLPADRGAGALLRGYVTRLAANTASFRPQDRHWAAAVLTDLVTVLFADAAGAARAVPERPHRRALTLRIRSFIARNLHDADLDPAAIAAAHHISVSHLHRLFREDGTSVARWIRERRLERARRELTDPDLRDLPVHAIAARCGFRHPAGFSRAFRAFHGAAPGEVRAASA